jgi:hypothetical protein
LRARGGGRVRLLSLVPERARRPLGSLGAIVIYLAAAHLLVGRGLLGNFTGRFVSSGAVRDPSIMIWCLAWLPHALANHLNLFRTDAVWFPVGINLAWVPTIPVAAMLTWPITRAFGPVASFNALSFLALPACAFSAFLLCRDMTGRTRASIVGGYVFGFSPYFLGQLQSHLFLLFAFPIPLAAMLTARLLEGRIGRRVFAPLMAVLLALQMGLSQELFATMTAVGIVTMLIGFAIGPEHWRVAVRNAAAPLAMSFALAALVASPYLYYIFAFGMPQGAINAAAGASIDPLNFLIPTQANWFGAHARVEAIASRFGYLSEAGAWIAWPLLAIIVLYTRARWCKPLGKTLIVTMVLLAIASLGWRLHIAGHELFGLPWKIVSHLPIMKSALPGRLTMYIFLILGVMTAVVLASPELPRPARYALTLAIAIFMLPNLDYRFWTKPVDLPAFFTDGFYAGYLHRDEVALILPFENRGDSMLWQADADFYFKMAGGYTGPGIIDQFQQWPAVNALYWGGEIDDPTMQLGAFMAAHNVRAVIVEDMRAGELAPILPQLSGISLSPTRIGGVVVYPIDEGKIAQYRDRTPLALEARYDRDRFDRLVVAADNYLSDNGDLRDLTPSRAAISGLLPRGWAVDRDIYSKDGLILGPWKSDRIQIGVVGSYEALKPLIADYRADAAEVYFPFPRPLADPPKGNTFMRKLVMVFEPAGLKRAARRASSELPADTMRRVPPLARR